MAKSMVFMPSYRCSSCKVERPYGNVRPSDVVYEPIIMCDKCGRPRRHSFVKMKTFQMEAYWRDGSIVHVSYSLLMAAGA